MSGMQQPTLANPAAMAAAAAAAAAAGNALQVQRNPHLPNGTARFKSVNNCLNNNIYSYLETSGGKSSNPYLNVVQFFDTSVN